MQTNRCISRHDILRLITDSRSGHVEFVVYNVALGQVFSEYFGFSCQFSFHRPLLTHHLSSGPGKIGQIVADVPSGLSLTPSQENKKKRLITVIPVERNLSIFSFTTECNEFIYYKLTLQ
jgi:hypothetical protein